MMHQDIHSLVVDRKAVMTGLGVADKDQLFEIIADQFAHIYRVESQRSRELLRKRETLGTTGFGRGIAIPHARIEGISQPLGLFVQLEHPVDYGSVDAQPVDLVWAMLSPVDHAEDHLRALAYISRQLRDEALVSRLRGARDHEAIYALLGEKLQRSAA